MSAVAAEPDEVALPTACAEHVVTEHEVAAHRRVVRSMIDDRPVPHHLVDPSPVYPYVLASHTFADVRQSLASLALDASPPAPVHLSEEIRIHRPLRTGEPIVATSDLVGARPDPRGARVAVRSQLSIPDGAAIAELMTTALLVGDVPLGRFGDVPLQRGRGGAFWTTSVTRSVARDLAQQYAQVSGDDSATRLDRNVAKAIGFPDAVVQGMSIVALACEEIIDRYADGDASRVRSIGARFSGPVAPGESLEIRLSDVDGGIVRFCCTTERAVAIRKAWVEIGASRATRGAGAR